MKRRDFLKTTAITGSTISATTAGLTLPFKALASPGYGAGNGRIVINTMLLGGADLRHLFVPPPSTAYGQKFWAARDSIFVTTADTAYDPVTEYNNNYNEITIQGTTFGINKNAGWLQQQLLAGNVGVVCNVKASENQRHDHSQLIVNSGDPLITNYDFNTSGWGGRLANAMGAPAANVLSYTNSISVYCFGNNSSDRNAQVISAPDTRNIALLEPGSISMNADQEVIARSLLMYYNKKYQQDFENTPYLKALQHEKQLRSFGSSVKNALNQPTNVKSPALEALINSSTGKLKAYAKQCSGIYDSLLVNETGKDIIKFRAASLEYGGWDSHKNEKATLDNNFSDLFGTNQSLHTLTSEIETRFGASTNNDITYVFTSDFGRQISSNGTNGTDHGKGTYTILIGGSVRGGIYGEMFPQSEITPNAEGLTPFDIEGSVIKGLSSYQRVLGELCDWAEPGSAGSVFPNRFTTPEENNANLYQLFYKNLFDINGVITSALGNAIVNASVVITSTSNPEIQWRTTSDNTGHFSIGNVAINGTYDIAISKTGYIINGSLVTVSNANETINFTAVANEFYGTVSGRITTPDGKGIGGIELWDALKYPQTVKTDKDGYFIINDYSSGQTVFLIASSNHLTYDIQAAGWNGSPFTHDGGAEVARNYIFTPKQGSVSGYIRDENGNGIANLEVWDATKYPETVTTDINGHYIITGYNNGNYAWIITSSQYKSYSISAEGWNGQSFVHDGSAVTERNYTFVAKQGTLSGRITTPEGDGVSGLTFWDVSKYPATVTTDDNGYYMINDYKAGDNIWLNMAPITSHSITASGWIQGIFLHDGSSMQRDFIATDASNNGTVSGRVTTPDGKGIGGIVLWDATKYPATVTTDKDGYYSVSGYKSGDYAWIIASSNYQTYHIQASGWSGGNFIHDGGATVGRNFIFTPKAGSVSGYIVDDNGKGIAGIKLWDAVKYPDTVTTDINGHYIITGYSTGDNAWIITSSEYKSYSMQATGWNGQAFIHDGSALTDRNYSFTRKPGTLSGRITSPDGTGIAGITFWDVSKYPEKVTTDANGYYMINEYSVGDNIWLNMNANGEYIISSSGWDGSNFSHDGSEMVRNFVAVLK